jgi:hypothetical protein
MANNPYDKLDPKEAETYAKLIAQIRREAEKLSKLKDNMVKGDKIQAELIEEQNKQLVKLRDRYKSYVSKLKEGNQKLNDQNEAIASIASTVNDMPKMYKEFGNQLKGSATISNQINDSITNIKDTDLKGFATEFNQGLQSAFDTLIEYAQLNSNDKEQIKAKSDEIANQYSLLKSMLPLIEESSELSEAQKQHFRDGAESLAKLATEAGKFANQSKEFKEVYGTLVDDLNGVGNGFRKIAATIELMFSNGRVAAAALLYGIGRIVEEFGELGKEIGVGITQMVALKLEALAFGKIFGETSKEAVIELQAALGDTRATTFGLNLDAATLAANYKLTGDQAAYIATAFGKVSGNSDEVGKNTLAFTKQLALTNGIMPSRAFQDIANSSEFVAKFTNESGKNIGTAAIAAGKLGVNLKTASTIANHLLDYQTSVDKEMEASVLLGREFNLQKARQLAYEGDIAGSMKEALNAAGGIDEFMSLDPIRRQAVADALGVSVDELQKMASQQKDLNGMNGVGAQIYSRLEETLQAIGNSLGGKIFNGFAAVVLFAGQLNMALMGTGLSIGGAIKSMGTFIAQLAKAAAMKLGLMGPEMVMSKKGDLWPANSPQGKTIITSAKQRAAKAAGTSVADNITPPSTNKASAGVNKLGGAGGGINASGLLKGAAAMLVMAGALYVLGAALQQFNLVEPASLLKMAGALIIVGAAMVGLSAIFANPVLAGGLGIATLGILGFGAAIYMVGGGIKLFSEGVSILSAALPMLATNLAPLVSMILPIFGLAAAITALSVSLAALSVSGTLALPVLAAVGLAAGAATAIFGGNDGGGNNSDLLAEIKGLRADLNSGKVAVNMDGKKVNTALAINNRRQVM